VTNPEALWKAWEGGWVDRLASKLYVATAVAPGHPSPHDWLQSVQAKLPPETALLGGELAAEQLGAQIRAETATLHVREWNARTMATLKLVPSPAGSFTIRKCFGDLNHFDLVPSMAHPLLIRAELLSFADERLDDARSFVAERIAEGLPDAG